MPPQNINQPTVGSLVQCRLTVGTFRYTCTRRVIQVLPRGRRFVLDGKGCPTVDRKNLIIIGRVIPTA